MHHGIQNSDKVYSPIRHSTRVPRIRVFIPSNSSQSLIKAARHYRRLASNWCYGPIRAAFIEDWEELDVIKTLMRGTRVLCQIGVLPAVLKKERALFKVRV